MMSAPRNGDRARLVVPLDTACGPDLGQVSTLLEAGADVVEVPVALVGTPGWDEVVGPERTRSVAVEATAGGAVPGSLARALTGTGTLVMVAASTGGENLDRARRAAQASGGGLAVIHPRSAAGSVGLGAGIAVLDAGDDLAAVAVGICSGYRWIRTTQPAAGRRVADVLAAVMSTP